ncbi:MAG: metal ABC transporter ATP-binding protein [Patescibacteria group bacterium]
MDTEKSILEVSDLKVELENRVILENVNFSLNKGEVMAIVGPNGAGKSTLFRALLGLIPYSGTIKWSNEMRIGYVPQKMALERDLPLTVREFLKLKSENYKSVLKEVGIHEHILDHSLGVISGGELQRVLIAWALLGNPNVLLFDEPTAGIDVSGEETIYHLLQKLHDSHELTVLIISHDMNVVTQYTNNILCLDKQMICFGETSEMLHTQKYFQHLHEH